MSREEELINVVDAALPQTQCRQCTYAGCRPYAIAMVTQGEQINRCAPGGVEVLQQLGILLQQDPGPYVAEMHAKTQPSKVAVIREAECIGCTKCIQACPVDAIIGASKQMHTVISDCCNGCELCVEPCPVDCIDLIPTTRPAVTLAAQSRQRYQQQQVRIKRQQQQQQDQQQHTDLSLASRQAVIQAAIARVRGKKTMM
jgi:electron transport complex protein RnfB